MNASCIICSDLFTQRSEIFSTGCGHLFHQDCISKWIERSKTCPQCRHKESAATIHRIYLNFASAEGIAEDVVTLQAQLDTVQFEMSLKQKDLTKYSEKYKACKAKCTRMREAIVDMESEQRNHSASMLALEYQLKGYIEKLQDKDKLVSEIEHLKTQIESMDHLKTVVSNCDQQVAQMLKQNNDSESLGILAVTLKKQLEDTKQKNQMMNNQIYRIGKEMLKTNNTIEKLKSRNYNMQKELKGHHQCSAEMRYLDQKIRDVRDPVITTITSNSLELDNSIIQLDSPNQSVLASPPTAGLYRIPKLPSTVTSQTPHTVETINLDESDLEVASTGSESSRRVSPPHQFKTGIKRAKSASSFTSSNKFRKLAPGNIRKPF